ncbi:uncharacterized protein LOC117108439 [Anneissia japonica]|uniref:uncharacterized protein LOC117108439 n=1 Tax=Anneissia japonica TaxID=1529436 RepID=UPI001425798C|nr:uncharacterized protein LOC117108439 [Anneissia japonica]
MSSTVFGKRQRQQLKATNVACHPVSRLFFITNKFSNQRFLIDTEAEVSVVPPTRHERKNRRHDYNLNAANNSLIATYGHRSITLDLGLRRKSSWIFVIADVSHPIIGADFLRHFVLLDDMTHHRLVDTTTNLSIQGILSKCPPLKLMFNTVVGKSNFDNILPEFPSITRPCYQEASLKHDVTHHFTTNGPPISATTPSPCARPLQDRTV